MGHWSVFSAGITTILVFWVITPLQSAVFATSLQRISYDSTVSHIQTVVPIGQQSSVLNTKFLNQAYGVSWLDAQLPSFTTKDLAVRPFYLSNNTMVQGQGETWTAPTVSCWTQLDCEPAVVTNPKMNHIYSFDDGQGCLYNDVGLDLAASQTFLQYIGYYCSPYSDYNLQYFSCPDVAQHRFLSIWADATTRSATGAYANMTALFCTPSYYTEDVMATVLASDLIVISVQPTGPPKPFVEFNITSFEHIIDNGISDIPYTGDFYDDYILNMNPKTLADNLSWPFTQMVGFARADRHISIAEFSQPATMHRAYENVHKLLFAIAMAHIADNNITPGDDTQGTRLVAVNAIVVIRFFAMILEVSLALVAIGCISLGIIYWKQPNLMSYDPASLADLMSLLPAVHLIDPLLGNCGYLTAVELEAKFHGERFELIIECVHGKHMLHLRRAQDSTTTRTIPGKLRASKKAVQGVRPIELRAPIGLMFSSMLLAAVAVLAIYSRIAGEADGMASPTSSILGNQIILN
ncbi:hypothetical protein MMC25_007719 [Agyrium rufum]|nr:hypothetical protein [Agyrium rufum]